MKLNKDSRKLSRQLLQRRAAFSERLAAEQIHPLNSGGAFVQRVELLIAQIRFGGVFGGISIAAEDLQRERARFEPFFRGKTLRGGRDQVQ